MKKRYALISFRTGRGLNQAEFAEKCGVCSKTLSFIERGIRSGSADFWSNLQTAFNVPDADMYALQKKTEKEC